MVQEIMKDMIFLAQPSDPATPDDLPCAQDLLISDVNLSAQASNKHHFSKCAEFQRMLSYNT